MPTNSEKNRFSARARRYANVGTRLGGTAARMAGARFFGTPFDRAGNALALAAALGGLKGPIMKVAQLLATIPDALPPEYANELIKLQSQAPPMGWAFVKRRMRAELGPDWEKKFESFEHQPAAAASLGQVHRASALDGEQLACKLQYPDMQSAVEADLRQLKLLFALRKRFDQRDRYQRDRQGDRRAPARGARLCARGQAHRALQQHAQRRGRDPRAAGLAGIIDRAVADDGLAGRPQDARAQGRSAWPRAIASPPRCSPPGGFPSAASASFMAIRISAITLSSTDKRTKPAGINLLDYGCIRVFPPSFVGGVVDLYRGLLKGDDALVVHAYETWGFKRLTRELIDALNIWARFIYGPLLDDRVRSIADGVKPSEYGRKEAFRVHQALKKRGPVTVPREFVFMDRAAMGLGAVFLHLAAELNFYRLFNEAIESFSVAEVARAARRARWRSGGTDVLCRIEPAAVALNAHLR